MVCDRSRFAGGSGESGQAVWLGGGGQEAKQSISCLPQLFRDLLQSGYCCLGAQLQDHHEFTQLHSVFNASSNSLIIACDIRVI